MSTPGIRHSVITNSHSGTHVAEIADGIYRICTPFPELPGVPGGFTFNQFLIVDDEPLLFHTGARRTFPLVREAVAHVMPVERLRHVAFSHFEADECGALNDFLSVAPGAQPLCGRLAAMLSVDDAALRPARTLADGESIRLGRREVVWFDTPHVPHNIECGYLMERTTGTLLCGDLFAQPGARVPPLTADDVFGPSETLRQGFDYARTPETPALVRRLAAERPRTLACMHGSSWEGDGASLLESLASALASARA